MTATTDPNSRTRFKTMTQERTTFKATKVVPYTNGGIGETTFNHTADAMNRIQEIEAEYEQGRTQYDAELGLKTRLRDALKGAKGTPFEGNPHALTRPAYVMSVASIQTPTPVWESATVEWLNGDIDLSTYLGRTENGETKFDCVRRTLKTDLIDRAESELRRNHLCEAVHYLTGGDTDVSTYLRGTKAWMVVRWFYHVPCIDTNVHKAIKPVLAGAVDTKPRFHRSMTERDKRDAEAKSDGDGRHSPASKAWIQERVGRYGEHDEMRMLWDIVDKAVRANADVPREVLAQVAFNVGGRLNNETWERTTHTPIYEALGGNLERFEE